MKIDLRGVKSVCCKGSSRYAITGARVRSDGKGTARIDATDGRIMGSRLEVCEGEEKIDSICPASILSPGASPVSIRDCSSEWRRLKRGGDIVAPRVEGSFPPMDDLWPSRDDDFVHSVSIDANLLVALAKMVSEDGKVHLEFPRNASKVVLMHSRIGAGLLMPAKADRDLEDAFDTIDRIRGFSAE